MIAFVQSMKRHSLRIIEALSCVLNNCNIISTSRSQREFRGCSPLVSSSFTFSYSLIVKKILNVDDNEDDFPPTYANFFQLVFARCTLVILFFAARKDKFYMHFFAANLRLYAWVFFAGSTKATKTDT